MQSDDRLAWVRTAVGYDEHRPGSLYPHLIMPDGGLQANDLWWQAGEDSIVLHGMYEACELEAFADHIFAVNAAIRAEARSNVPPAFSAHVSTPKPASLRERFAIWLLHRVVHVLPKGQEADMLEHLARYWRTRWFV